MLLTRQFYAGVAVLALTLAPLQMSCRGGPCERVRADRTAFQSQRSVASLSAGHQVEALVPLALLQDRLNQAFLQFKGVAFQFNTLGQVGKFLGTFKLKPHKLALMNEEGQLKVATDFAVTDHQGNDLFNLGVAGVVSHEFNQDRVVFALKPDGFRMMGMRIDQAAVGMLMNHFRAQIPPTIAAFLPDSLVNEAADLALREFKTLWQREIEGKLARQVAGQASIQVKLPPLPFSGFSLNPVGNALALQLTTQVGTKHPLKPLTDVQLGANEICVRLAGGLLAALGNQAIADGLIPNRYNTNGEPDQAGTFVPGIGWEPSERPFQLKLWSDENLCARVHMSAMPRVSIVNQTAVVAIENDNLEEVWGPWWFEAGFHSFDVWQKMAEQSTDLALKVALDHKDLPMPLVPTNVEFTSNGLEASLALAE